MTGKTTRQMQNAPKGAVYVWPHARSIGYAQGLRTFLKRPDLRIVSAEWLDTYRGGRPVVVIDHACALTMKQDQTLDIYQHACKI